MADRSLSQKQLVERMFEREDNLYLKKEFIENVLEMYHEEIGKALMNGEGVTLKGIGSLIPKIHCKRTGFSNTVIIDGNEEVLPYIGITLHRNIKFREAIDKKLRRNYIEKGKLELENGRPPAPRY